MNTVTDHLDSEDWWVNLRIRRIEADKFNAKSRKMEDEMFVLQNKLEDERVKEAWVKGIFTRCKPVYKVRLPSVKCGYTGAEIRAMNKVNGINKKRVLAKAL